MNHFNFIFADISMRGLECVTRRRSFPFFNVPGIAASGVFSNGVEKKREAVKEEKKSANVSGLIA